MNNTVEKKRIILGIHDGFDCSAAFMINGKIVYAAQEERFSNFKTDYGLPINSIKSGLKFLSIKTKDINEVSLATHNLSPIVTRLKRETNFSVENHIEEQDQYWFNLFYKNKKPNYYKIFKNKIKNKDTIYNYKGILKNYKQIRDTKIFRDRRKDKISSLFKINKDKIKIQIHEDCHKYYSYFFFPKRKDGIAITCEGIGDYSRGSVSTIQKGNFKLKSYSLDNHIGNIYKYTTALLKMKPAQHEYKVMGLAPYATNDEINKCFKYFDEILKIKGLKVIFKKKPKDLYFHLQNKLKKFRFDVIAGALQKFTEKKLFEWFYSCTKKLKLKTFYFSGGVAQNIKAGMSLNLSKKFNKVLIPVTAGDSSLSIGACFKSASDYCEKKNLNKDNYIKHIDNIYLGPQITKLEIEKFIKQKKIKNKYLIKKNITAKYIAKEIFKGNIIGRCSGRMEFGMRALGNRSILCDPRFFANIRKINLKIKKRDFWMPFTPSIIKEDFNKYVINKKKINADFMTMAFDTTKLGRKNLQAAIHPADYSVRPQKVDKVNNPEYYKLIREFKKISGVGALLNTSFNLHGLPIVRTAKDAFYVFENSNLDGVIIENYYFKKFT